MRKWTLKRQLSSFQLLEKLPFACYAAACFWVWGMSLTYHQSRKRHQYLFSWWTYLLQTNLSFSDNAKWLAWKMWALQISGWILAGSSSPSMRMQGLRQPAGPRGARRRVETWLIKDKAKSNLHWHINHHSGPHTHRQREILKEVISSNKSKTRLTDTWEWGIWEREREWETENRMKLKIASVQSYASLYVEKSSTILFSFI